MKSKFTRWLFDGTLAVSLALSNVTFVNAQSNTGFTLNTDEALSTSASGKYEKFSDAISKSKSKVDSYLDNEVVDFIVELEGNSLLDSKPASKTMKEYLETSAGKTAQKKIENVQSSVKSTIQKARSANMSVECEYSVVLNGLAVKAPYSAMQTLESIPGVKSVTVAQVYDYVEPLNGYTKAVHTSGEMIDSDRANAEGYTGKGVVTAVLDSGLDVEHEAFANDPANPSMDEADVSAFVAEGKLQATAEASDLYKSAKVPYAYDYADQDTNVLGPNNHGTHVAGSVGASCEELTGVAPDTQLVIMKVFSDNGPGASDVWIFAALEDCVLMGVDTINMSLGSPAGFSTDSAADQVYNKVKDAGITLMVAAGNDTDAVVDTNLGTNLPLVSEPDSGIVGSPSTYSAAVSVASVNEEQIFSAYVLAGDQHIVFVDSNSGTDKEFNVALNNQTLEYVSVPGFGGESDFMSVDVTGKIALVSRGDISFVEKEANAHAAGAAGVVIYDNVDGELPSMQLNGLLPMVAISKADGKLLKNLETKTISISKDYQEYIEDEFCGLMSDFSSLGVTPDLKLKPEITAPGGNVYSTLPGSVYGNMSGTSMASPHMAGAASVVHQYLNETYPDLVPTEKTAFINTLLMNTAVPVKDDFGVAYTPRKQGAGLAEIYNAIHTGAYVTVNGSERPKAELGDSADGYFSKSITLTVHNISDNELTYDMSAIPLVAKEEAVEVYGKTYQCISNNSRELNDNEFQVLFSENTVTVAAGESKEVEVKLRLTEAGAAGLSAFTNGIYLDGFITLESQNEDGIDLSVPYLGFYGDWGASPVFDDSAYDEEEASVFSSAMAIFDTITGNGFYLGMNLLSDEPAPDEDKIAVASRKLGYERVFSCLGLLRSPESLEYSITTLDGETEYYNSKTEQVVKSFYYANGGFVNYEMGPTYDGWAPVYIDEEGIGRWVPDGDYLYNVTAKVAGTDSEAGTQSVAFPISVDNTAPQLVSTQYEVVDGVPYLVLNVTDNNYLMGCQVISADGKEAYSDILIADEDEKGAVTSYLFDVSALQEAGLKTAKIYMMDYATNDAISTEFSLVSQDVEPVSVRINNREMTFSGECTAEISATVSPDNAVDKTLTWTSSDESIVKVEGTDRIDELGGIVAYITTFNVSGSATITATTVNGLSDTINVTVIVPGSEIPEDYTIREDGYYRIPANLNREVKITDNARNVVIEGSSENTVDNPYQDLRFVSDVTEGLNLTIRNINTTTNSANVIKFAGKGNTLTVAGTNSFKGIDGRYLSKALINVNKDVELTVNGSGTLDLYVPQSSYGAGIGADAGSSAGYITIDGPTLNITSYSGGAGIGGGSNGSVQKVTVNSGVVNVDVPLCGTSDWSSNLTTTGAGIGTGDNVSNSSHPTPVIEINGGEVNGKTWTNAPVIGTSKISYGNSVGAIITINGGKVNAEAMKIDPSWSMSVTDGPAAIGVGTSVQGATSITINGGEVVAKSHGYGPAIGGGVNAKAGNVYVNGGTVTAIADCNSTEYMVPAIGAGRFGTAGVVQINKGSVKAVSANTDAIHTTDGRVLNDDNDQVFETKLAAPEVKNVMVNGVDWKVNANHPEDDMVYLWLTSDQSAQTVVAETENGNKNYEVVVKGNGDTDVKEFYSVTYDLVNLTTDAPTKVYAENDLTGTLSTSSVDGYSLPSNITVTVDGVEVPVTYDEETGNFTVAAEYITGTVVVSAAAGVTTDKSDLEALIAQVEGMSSENYTETSWNHLTEVLAQAKAVYENDLAEQVDVDAAYEALLAAVDELQVRANLDALNALIAEADKYVETEYVSAGWNEFKEALAAAKAVAADPNAVQGDADAAYEALQTAMDGLTRRANKTELRKAIDEADVLFESDYTEDSWTNSGIEEALENAIAVYVNTDATQSEVDEATLALRAALNKLNSFADKTELLALIETASGLDREVYTQVSWDALMSALAAAQAVANDKDALQSSVDEAANSLRQAIAELELLGDTTELEALIEEVEQLNKDAYTPASWEESQIEELLQQAKDMMTDPNATQADVDAAYEALQDAMDALVERANKDALESLVDEAQLVSDSNYTEASWNAFKDALDKAIAVLEDPNATQAEVDQAHSYLQFMLDNLVESGDKTELQKAYDEYSKLSELEYTVDSFKTMNDALANAKAVLDDSNATQEDVDAALEQLNNAFASLVEAGDASDLITLVKDTEKALDEYTDESAAAIKEALDAAKEVIKNRGTQEEIDAAKAALEETLKDAVKKPADNNNSNTGSDKENGTNTDNDDPQTGDSTSAMSWMILLTISALGIVVIRRRHDYES